MQSPGEIEDKIPCQSEEDALAWDRQLCLGQWQWTRRGWRQPQEIHRGRKRAKKRVRLHGARGSAELKEVASGSATHGLWLRNGKVRSQVSGIDRSRFPRRRTVEDKEGEPAIERKRKYTDLGLDLGEREEQVVCHATALALAMTDEARREAEM